MEKEMNLNKTILVLASVLLIITIVGNIALTNSLRNRLNEVLVTTSSPPSVEGEAPSASADTQISTGYAGVSVKITK